MSNPTEKHFDWADTHFEDAKKIALFFILAAGLVAILRTWHGRAIDIELIHRFPSGDELLPAAVEIQVWRDDVLLADAFFPNPRSLRELDHSARLPRGDYRVTFTVMRSVGEIEVRFEHHLTVHEEGRYFLTYELQPE